MTSQLLALESSLRENWSLETLSVYADVVQEQGQPWGELCALYLQEPHEAQGRILEILTGWFGKKLGKSVGSLINYGFVFDLKSGIVADAILDSPLAAYVWAYEAVVTDVDATIKELKRLAGSPKRWMERLSLSSPYNPRYVCDPGLCLRLVQALPNIKYLSYQPRISFSGDILHPTASTAGTSDLSCFQFEEILRLVSSDQATLLREAETRALEIGDSTLLLHLHNANLLRMCGPFIQATVTGQSWLHAPTLRKSEIEDPGFTPGRYEVYLENSRRKRRYRFDRMTSHVSFVMHCMTNFPLDEQTYATILSYLKLLQDVWDNEGVSFGVSKKMLRALGTLWSWNKLAEYGLDIEPSEDESAIPQMMHFGDNNQQHPLVLRLEWD